MLIEIFGLDPYVIAKLSKQLHHPLVKLTNIDDKTLFFSAHETMLFHHGVDQNAWHTLIRIHLPTALRPHQQAIMSLFQKMLQEQTVHLQFQFNYLDVTTTPTIFQADYPLFVTEKNQVAIAPEASIETDEEDTQQEIYHGNVFADKEADLEKAPPLNKKTLKKKVTN
jgi:hypothetical protein